MAVETWLERADRSVGKIASHGAVAANAVTVTEIFFSLQGESSRVGLPTVFVRLTGCPLRCQYCDTAYAFSGGESRTFEEIVAQVTAYEVRHVCVTGGEPLAQRACVGLLSALCDANFSVSLETSGAMDIGAVDARVSRIVDIKTPGSREQARNRESNLELLRETDEIKFVICDRADYEWAREFLKVKKLADRCSVLFSPSHTQLPAAELANWVIEDRLPVRFQTQLHKILWGEVAGK